jgi:hypothetical protein
LFLESVHSGVNKVSTNELIDFPYLELICGAFPQMESLLEAVYKGDSLVHKWTSPNGELGQIGRDCQGRERPRRGRTEEVLLISELHFE